MEELISYGKKLYEQGLSPASTGNISKLTVDGILISASGSMASCLTNNDIVKIDFDGNIISGVKNASSEKLTHIKIYQKRSDIKAIIHSHSPEITAFAASGKEINEAIIPELPVYFKKVPLVEYSMPSTIKLAEDVSNRFVEYCAVLMKNHGVIVGAKDLKTAFCLLETLQMYAKIYLYSKLLGGAVSLNEAQIEDLKQIKR